MEKSLDLNGISQANQSQANKPANNSISILHFDWCNLNQQFLSTLPRIDRVIGSDVFFENKCNFFFTLI